MNRGVEEKMKYVLGIDQSTQGTKAILVDQNGSIIGRADASHRQIINEKGWVSHDLNEIYTNVLKTSEEVIRKTGIDADDVTSIGISNQRETTAAWDEEGNPLACAIVWQCARAQKIADDLKPYAKEIQRKTGLQLSPYFPGAKMAWLLQNEPEVKKALPDRLKLGTIDSWLIYKLTDGRSFATDYSNASRTQLFHLQDLVWDEELCDRFGIPVQCLPEVMDSNADFGETDLGGLLRRKIPIHAALGDSHAALFGQGCYGPGTIKTTYGTGSSVMMNIGKEYRRSRKGLVTSIAWGIDGKVNYVLEGNINYTGAVISWLKDDLGLISSPGETADAAAKANPEDRTILVPAFSGLSAPYWCDSARALICNMSRTTGRNEIIRAALNSIALQINAVLQAMEEESGYKITEIRVDGGPTKNPYLMQLQSDLSHISVAVSSAEEISALGAALMAGTSQALMNEQAVLSSVKHSVIRPNMSQEERKEKILDWEKAVALVVGRQGDN